MTTPRAQQISLSDTPGDMETWRGQAPPID